MAPLHYRIGPDVGGSELSWAYEIVKQVLRFCGRLDAIVADAPGTDLPANAHVFETSPGSRVNYFTDAIEPRLRFMAQYSRLGTKLVNTNRYDVLHHVLPWSTSTFNPLILSRGFPFGVKKATRIIAGPFHGEHEVQFDDEGAYNRFSNSTDARRGSRSLVRPLLELGAKALHERTLRGADRIVALTPDAKTSLSAYVGSERITVIPAGIDASRFPAAERSGRGAQLTLATASYFLQRKGIELIVRALAELRGAGHDARLLVGGEGPQRDALLRETDALGLNEYVDFRGLLDAEGLRRLYADADVYVSMSWSETFGVAMLEAMSTGLAVVSADNIGARQIVEPERTGFTVPRGDAHALADVLARYARNPALAAVQGEEAARSVRTRFSWNAIGDQYERLYEEVIDA